MRPDGSHHQRVAVAGRLGDDVGTDIAAGPRLVVDYQGLAELRLLAEQPREYVGRAAGREGDDQSYRSGRVGLRR